jgi:hypothetical protein
MGVFRLVVFVVARAPQIRRRDGLAASVCFALWLLISKARRHLPSPPTDFQSVGWNVSCEGLKPPLKVLAFSTVGPSWWTSKVETEESGPLVLVAAHDGRKTDKQPYHAGITARCISFQAAERCIPLVQPGIELGAADKCDGKASVISGNSRDMTTTRWHCMTGLLN